MEAICGANAELICFIHGWKISDLLLPFTCLLNLSQPVQKYQPARDAARARAKTKAATGLGTDTAAPNTLGSEPSEAAETHHCDLLCCRGGG